MKRNPVLAFFLIVLPGLLFAQNLLSSEWRFSVGEEPSRAIPGFDDEDWRIILHGKIWEQQGVGAYYLKHYVDDPELYIYRGAYMDCLRALDFLFSRPEVDTTRVAVMGGSQGGTLSFATAALAPDRIALCAPSVPFLSDFRDYFKVGAWPASEFVQYVSDHPEVGWEKVYQTLSYIDIKNLAPWMEAPVFMGVGLLAPPVRHTSTSPLTINWMYPNLTWSTRKPGMVCPRYMVNGG